MTGNEYQRLAGRTINEGLTPSGQEHHALYGMMGEIGEISSMYQKVYQGHPFNRDHLKKEIGDLLWFVAEFCTAHGWELDEVMQANLDKLWERYPNGFEKERSLHRTEGDV